VVIGSCIDTLDCTYNLPDLNFADPFGTSPIHSMVLSDAHKDFRPFGDGRMDYFPITRTWFTQNFEMTLSYSGRVLMRYLPQCPEPSAWWLIGFGFIGLARAVHQLRDGN
jgi:hypothetical protein